jgi:hypothetical protein
MVGGAEMEMMVTEMDAMAISANPGDYLVPFRFILSITPDVV